MRNRFGRLAALVLMATLALTACGDDEGSPTEPTDPNPPVERVTDTYTGTLAIGAADTYPFAVKAKGQVDAQLVEVGPLSTMSLGVALGTWDGTNCTVVTKNDNVKAGTTVIGTASAAVNLCLRVYDVGNIWDTATYKVNVVHP